MFIKKDTFLSYNFKDFHNNLKMYKDILLVGIPASLEHLILSALIIVVNFMLTLVSGSVAVAVFTAGGRIIAIGMLPAIGVGTAAISASGVAYGSGKYENLRVVVRYAVKVALISSIIVCIILNLFSSQIAYIFSYSKHSAHLEPLIGSFLQIMCLFILYVPFGASAGNVFQGVGKGTISFILTAIREFVLVLVFAYVLGFIFKMGEFGIYSGMLLGGCIGSIIEYVAIEYYIKKLITVKKMEKHNIPTVPFISIIYREHAKFLNDKLKDEDLTYGLYPLLINIYQYEGIIQEELAKIFHLNESTITRNLKKLEEKGFIERTSNKRTNIIKTTPKGKHTAQKIRDYDMQWDNKIIEIIGQKEYLNLKDNLKRICDSMV